MSEQRKTPEQNEEQGETPGWEELTIGTLNAMIARSRARKSESSPPGQTSQPPLTQDSFQNLYNDT